MRKSCWIIIAILMFIPTITQANFNHILFYHKSEKYILLHAFPLENPKAAKSVLFSHFDWQKQRYSDSEEIFSFFSALGFTDQNSRIKFKSIFQTKPPTDDKFRPRNWSNLFNWLSDMRIEEIDGSVILLKEYSGIPDSLKDVFYNQRNYFPSLMNFDNHLPRLIIQVNGNYTNTVDFHAVPVNQKSTAKVILRAENLNNALLTISPLDIKHLDNSLTVDNADKSIFLSEYKSDTLIFEFAPAMENTIPEFWKDDTMTCRVVLNGDYLPQPENLIIKGVRIAAKKSSIPLSRVILIVTALILMILGFVFKKYLIHFINQISRFRKKQTDNEPAISEDAKHMLPSVKTTNQLHVDMSQPEAEEPAELSMKITDQKKPLSREVSLFLALRQLYHEHADSIKYKELLKKMFGAPGVEDSDFVQIAEKINSAQLEKVKEIEKLRWYREAFDELKENFKISEMEDIEAKVFLTKQRQMNADNTIYELISEYCYKPILKDAIDFKNCTDPLHKNIEVLQKNKEKLIELQSNFTDLELIKKEITEFIVDVNTGFINNLKDGFSLKSVNNQKKDNEEKNIVDFENYLSLKELFDSVTKEFYALLSTIRSSLIKIDKANISPCWNKIVDQILFGASGLSGINSCIARYESLNNPNIICNLLDITNVSDCKRYSKKKAKIIFRNKFILKPFCWAAIQNLIRLSIYLDRKDFRIGDDTELFSKVKFLSEELKRNLIEFDIYPHQISLITATDAYKEIAEQLADSAMPYLEFFKPIRSKLKFLVLTKELKPGYIYDVESIGYEIKHNGAIHSKKYEPSRVKILKGDVDVFD